MRTPATLHTLHLEIAPAPALRALLALRDAASAAGTALSARIRRETTAEIDRARPTLAVLDDCLEWLLTQRLARVPRSARKASASVRPACAVPTVIDVDVRRLAQKLATESSAEEPAHVTAFALSTLLEHLGKSAWIVPSVLRAGRVHADPEAVRTVLARTVEGANEREAHARAEREAREREARERAERERAEREAREARERAEREARAKAAKEAPRAKRAKGKGRASGFGGLPEDAQPEDRITGSPLGPRGISLDAEYFLAQAEISAWPCAAGELERGRKRALARLHPDRAGESATALFQRAARGHAELVRRLSTVSKSAAGKSAAGKSAAGERPASERPASYGAVGEWPPRAAASEPARSEQRAGAQSEGAASHARERKRGRSGHAASAAA